MFKYLNKAINRPENIFMLFLVVGLSACSSSSVTISCCDNCNNESSTAQIVSIDNAGTIPVVSKTSTTTVIYVHNNRNVPINGVTYNVVGNTNISTQSVTTSTVKTANASANIIIDPNSAALCANLAPNQSCPLTITTPVISEVGYQGSAMISADYQYQGNKHTFNQVVSYRNVVNDITAGAKFDSGVTISGFGNRTGFATLYLYGSGQNQVYDVSQIKSNVPGVSITQGDMTGKQIQSNYIQAVEVSSAVPTSPYVASLTAISNNDAQTFNSTVGLGVSPTTNGPIFSSGLIPLINTSLTESGSMFIVNNGNAPGVINSIVLPNTFTSVNGGSGRCVVGTILAIGQGCTVYFSLPIGSGSDLITTTYDVLGSSGGQLTTTQNVTWFNSLTPALAMTVEDDPLNFTGTTSASNMVTVTNVGTFILSDVLPNASPTATGGATTSISSNGTCNSVTLIPGDSCSYTVSVVAGANTNATGYVVTGVSGDYVNTGNTSTYSRNTSFVYNAYGYFASLSLTPNPLNISVTGNDTSTQEESISVVNNGSAPAVILSSGLSGNPSYLTITNNGCANGLTLAAGESCAVTVQLGEVSSETQINESAILLVTYGGGETASSVESALINYTVLPKDINISINDVTPSNSACFITSTIPYQLNGGSCNGTASDYIQIEYVNDGNTSFTIVGIDESNSSAIWQLDRSQTTCVVGQSSGSGQGAVTLAPNSTCIVQYNYVLPLYANGVNTNTLGGIGATLNVPLSLPTLILKHTLNQYQVQPEWASSTAINAISNQATVTNLTPVYNPGAQTLSVGQTMANATYNAVSLISSITVNTTMENYFTNVVSSSCPVSISYGIINQTCVFTGNGTLSNLYTINQAYIGNNSELNLGYTANTNKQIVGFSSNNAVYPMPN